MPTKSVSFGDESYLKLIQFKPEDENFSSWIEKLSMEGLVHGNESEEHLSAKLEKGLELLRDGWEVSIEQKLPEGYYVDIYAEQSGETKIIEVGDVSASKEEELKQEYDYYDNISYDGYEKTGKDITLRNVPDDKYWKWKRIKDEQDYNTWKEFFLDKVGDNK